MNIHARSFSSYVATAAAVGVFVGLLPVGLGGCALDSESVPSLASALSCDYHALDMTKATSDGGFAWFLPVTAGVPADTSSAPTQSPLQLFENSNALGPAHSLHADIRALGAGRFSHWNGGGSEALRFAASDNSNPKTNGRQYGYCTTAATAPAVSLTVQGAPNLPLNGTTTLVTVGFVSGTPTRVDLSRDGRPVFATYPGGSFFMLAADGKSLTGNWCISSECWSNVPGAHHLDVVATYANGATATASVALNVADSGGSCTPTTCAAKGVTCGTTSDGCGGTLNCGTCTAPQLQRLEVISTSAVSGDGGNGWGVHKNRVVRASNGDIFAVSHEAGGGTADRTWAVFKRASSGGWSRIAQGNAGREPANLLRQPNDVLRLFTWPGGGAPNLVSAAGADGALPFTSTAVPGSWQINDHPYAGASVGPNGDLVVLQSIYINAAYSPGQDHIARMSSSGQWNDFFNNTNIRYAYAFLLPDQNGGLTYVGTGDVPWSTLGYSQPSGSFSFVFDQARVFYTPSPGSTSFSSVVVAHESQSNGSYLDMMVSDAYLDTQGRTHVLYYRRGADTNQQYVGHHAVLQGTSLLKDVSLANIPCPNASRITQDTAGTFYLLTRCNGTITVTPGGNGDGTAQGSTTTLNVSSNPPSSHIYIAVPRSGTPLADYVDAVWPSSGDTSLVYARIRLR